MRVNIYAEEMPDEPRLEIIEKEIEGHKFTALRIYLELPVTLRGSGEIEQHPVPASYAGTDTRQVSGPFIHHLGDDDSAAVTFWGKRDLRVTLRKALAMLDEHYAKREMSSADGQKRECPDCKGLFDIGRPHLCPATLTSSQGSD